MGLCINNFLFWLIKAQNSFLDNWYFSFRQQLIGLKGGRTCEMAVGFFSVFFQNEKLRFIRLFLCQKIYKFQSCWSFFRAELKTPTDDFSALVTDFLSKWNSKFFESLVNLTHMLAIIESFSHQAFKKNDSKGPDLCFFIVNVLLKRLWSHVWRRTNIILKRRFLITFNLTIPKINYFWYHIVQHDVSWL